MRNVAVLAVLMLAAAAVALPSMANAAAMKKEDPAVAAQRNTANFIRDAMNPYEATKPKPAKAKKAKAKSKKKKA